MSLALRIASLVSHNADPSTTPDTDDAPAIVETVIARNKPTGEQAAPKAPPPVVTLPSFPKLDAKGFIAAIRKAKTRDESIAAIVSYTGHERVKVASDFGRFDAAARAQAQRELSGKVVAGPSREEQRAAARSAQGFVAGMPQPSHRLLLNLQARERAAVNAMIDATTEAERQAQAKVLDEVRAAIDELVG